MVDLLNLMWVSVHTLRAWSVSTVVGKALYIFYYMVSVEDVNKIRVQVSALFNRNARDT